MPDPDLVFQDTAPLGDNSIKQGPPKKFEIVKPAVTTDDAGRVLAYDEDLTIQDTVSIPDDMVATDPLGKPIETIQEAADIISGYKYNAQDYYAFKNALQSSDPEAFIAKWEKAKLVANAYDLDPVDALQNLDVYLDHYWGEKGRGAKTDLKAIADSFGAGAKMIELGMAGSAAWADEAQTERMQQVAKEIAELQLDDIPRDWWVDYAKTIGNVAPFTAYMAGTSFLAGLVSSGVGSALQAANLTKTAVLVGKAISAVDMLQSASIMNGLAYNDMISKGIPRDQAFVMAPIAGVINTAIERGLGTGLEGLSKAAGIKVGGGVAAKEALARRVTGKFLLSGGLDQAVGQFGKVMLKSTLGETAEEGTQALTDGLIMMVAEAWAEESGTPIMDKTTASDVFGDVVENVLASLAVAPILGLPAGFIVTKGDIETSKKNAQNAVNLAQNMTPDQFQKIAATLPLFDGVDQKQLPDAASAVYEAAQAQKATAGIDARAEAEKQSKTEGQVDRTEQGGLYTQQTVSLEDTGRQTVVYSVGSNVSGKNYADLELDIRDGQVTVVGAEFDDAYTGLADEIVEQLAAEFPNQEIILGEELELDAAFTGAFKRVKESFGEKVTFADRGVNKEDAKAMTAFKSQLRDTGTVTPLQGELTSLLVERMAARDGKSFAEFTKGLEFKVDPQAKAQGVAGSFQTVADAVGAAKKIITLAENANFATVVHEVGHFARQTIADKTLLAPFEAAYAVQGDWTTEQEERFTNDLMQYIKDGKVKDEKLKPLFQRVADFLHQLWRRVFSKGDMDSRVEQGFDELFRGYTPQATPQATQQATQQEVAVVAEEPIVDPVADAEHFNMDTDKLSEELQAGVAEIKKIVGDDGPLFMTQEEMRARTEESRRMAAKDAGDFDTYEAWLDALYGEKKEMLSGENEKWLRGVWEYAHSGKGKKYPKKGDLAKDLSKKGMSESFLRELYRALNDKTDIQRRTRIRELLSKAPVVSRLVQRVKDGPALTKRELADFRAYVRRNESVMKLLVARVFNDADLGYEAVREMEVVPQLERRIIAGRGGMTIAEQNEIIAKITDESLKARVKMGTFTLKDLEKHRAMAKNTTQDETAEANARTVDIQIKAAIARMRRGILKRVSGSVNLEQARLIQFIQEYLRGTDKGFDEQSFRSLSSIVFKKNPQWADTMVGSVKKISTKPFSQWTYNEIKMMYDTVKSLEKIGKAEAAARRRSFGAITQALTDQVYAALPKDKDVLPPGWERDEAQKKLDRKYLGDRSTADMFRFARHVLDGKKEGVNTQLLANDMVRVQNEKLTRYGRRTDAVRKAIDSQKALVDGKQVRLSELIHKQVTIPGMVGKSGGDLRITREELLGAYLLVGASMEEGKYNKAQRQSYIFGNLFSREERQGMETDELLAMENERAQKLIDAATSILTKEELAVGAMVLAALNDMDSWTRFHEAVYDSTGREMFYENYYFPIKINGGFQEGQDAVADLLAGSGFTKGVMDMGITLDRSNIKPQNRTRIATDTFRIFYDSIRQQEHISAYARPLRTVKKVYTNPVIRERIETQFGDGAYKTIENYINVLANPGDSEIHDVTDNYFGLLRGAMVISTLSWRLGTIAAQAATSPLPFLQEVNVASLLKEYALLVRDPAQYILEAEAMSGVLKFRQIDPVKEVQRMKDTGVEGFVKKVGQAGMLGLATVDRGSVAIGWMAVYKKQLAKGMSTAEASDYANKMVARTQPMADDMFRAPLYQNMSFAKRALLQFTHPLSVIWQQIRYDVPQAVHERDVGKAVSIISLYAVSGFMMGVVWAMRGRGPEDEEDWLKYYAWAMTSQFTDAIPLVGDFVSEGVRSVALDEAYRPMQREFFPAAADTMKAIMSVGDVIADPSEDQIYRALGFSLKAVGRITGVPPVGAMTEAKAIAGVLMSNID